MPRTVRNFWCTVESDARQTAVETGPRASDGGITITLQNREKGAISDDQLRIEGYVENGVLKVNVFHRGNRVYNYEAER